MVRDYTLEKYLDSLLQGDRKASRAAIEGCLQSGIPANRVYMDVLWPIMVEVDRLYRDDVITSAQEHLASRINRTIVDQLQNKLPRKEQKNKRIVICCTSSEYGELGAQMAADLFESDGWDIRFLGGGVANDELIAFTNEFQPEILLIYGSAPQQGPEIRALVDSIKNINGCPEMQIMLSGGIFERAEGLWEEIGADMYAVSASRAVELANMYKSVRPKPTRTINKRKRSTKKQQGEILAVN